VNFWQFFFRADLADSTDFLSPKSAKSARVIIFEKQRPEQQEYVLFLIEENLQ
jgi:hypothetical protein